MDINKIDDFLYMKTKKALDSFFEYMKPVINLLKEKGINYFSGNEKEILKDYNKENILYQINTTSLIMELFLVIELYVKTELFKINECFLYRSIDKYPEEKKKENALIEKKNKEFEILKENIATANEKENKDRLFNISLKFAEIVFDIREPCDFTSVNVKEAIRRLYEYLNWNIPDDLFKKFNILLYCRNEIINFGKFDNHTIGSISAINVMHSFADGADDEKQCGFYKNFSKIPNEYEEQINYLREIIHHIHFHEHWENILKNHIFDMGKK